MFNFINFFYELTFSQIYTPLLKGKVFLLPFFKLSHCPGDVCPLLYRRFLASPGSIYQSLVLICQQGTVQEDFSCANELKCVPSFIIIGVTGVNIGVLDLYGIEFCIEQYIVIYFHSSTCSSLVQPEPLAKKVFLLQWVFGFFVKKNNGAG